MSDTENTTSNQTMEEVIGGAVAESYSSIIRILYGVVAGLRKQPSFDETMFKAEIQKYIDDMALNKNERMILLGLIGIYETRSQDD
jgi:hypothetical protein